LVLAQWSLKALLCGLRGPRRRFLHRARPYASPSKM
jgi:hypothetical protein